jgi:hypothetical protein
MDPAFQSLLAGLLKQETDAAVAEPRKLHHALRLRKISLGDPQVANGIGISHPLRQES